MSLSTTLLQAIAILLLVSGEPMKGDECQLKRQEEVLDLEGAAGLYQVTLAMTAVNFTSEHKQSLMHTHLAMQAFSNDSHDANVQSRLHILPLSFPLV